MTVPAIRIYLAHGASGSAASMRPWTDGLRARGFEATPVQLPRGAVERAIPVYRAAAPSGPSTVIGGQSFGGRVASLIAADQALAGLVLLSYPLHRPGHPETVEARIAHWPRIACPVLLLSGEADPFARIQLLREGVSRLPNAQLLTYPRLGHGLNAVREDALDRIAAWLGQLAAA